MFYYKLIPGIKHFHIEDENIFFTKFCEIHTWTKYKENYYRPSGCEVFIYFLFFSFFLLIDVV